MEPTNEPTVGSAVEPMPEPAFRHVFQFLTQPLDRFDEIARQHQDTRARKQLRRLLFKPLDAQQLRDIVTQAAEVARAMRDVTHAPQGITDLGGLDAVKQWVYKPTLLNGEAVEVITQIDVNFTLSQ